MAGISLHGACGHFLMIAVELFGLEYFVSSSLFKCKKEKKTLLDKYQGKEPLSCNLID